jgi:hypothetical protein
MRFLIVIIVLLLAVYKFMPEPEPVPLEEGIIGEQVKVLRKAENYEDQYIKSTDARKEQMEDHLEKSAGGG